MISVLKSFVIVCSEDDQHYAWWKVAVGCFPSLSDADKAEAIVDVQFYHDMVSIAYHCLVPYLTVYRPMETA